MSLRAAASLCVPIHANHIKFAEGLRYRLIGMTERGDFAIVAYGYAVPRAIPRICSTEELVKSHKGLKSVIPAKAGHVVRRSQA